MKLLHTSVSEDGYTQPIVAMWDPNAQPWDPPPPDGAGPGRYIIVDGFHRYTVLKKYADIAQRTLSYLPVVVIDKPIADRIASTVRHNRARGKHSVTGMGNLIFEMLREGETPEEVCNKLGLEPTELARLTHVTGYSKLYGDIEFSRPVLTTAQARAKSKYAADHPDEVVPNDF
jgi:ParB-like chromosome segregation protein Spo0J